MGLDIYFNVSVMPGENVDWTKIPKSIKTFMHVKGWEWLDVLDNLPENNEIKYINDIKLVPETYQEYLELCGDDNVPYCEEEWENFLKTWEFLNSEESDITFIVETSS